MSTYFSYKALVSMRSSGYQNTQYALAELIDNSLDAEATNIRITFVESINESGRLHVDEIIVSDDGYGMSEKVLFNCLQFGGGVNNDVSTIVKKKKIGKFGFGLPNASLSQCTCVTVYSKEMGSDWKQTSLDLEALRDGERIDLPPVKKAKLPEHFETLGISRVKSGTIISWKNCDRLSYVRAKTLIERSGELIGQIYRYQLVAGKKIGFECFERRGKNLIDTSARFSAVPNDPLFLMKNTYVSGVLHRCAEKTDISAEYFAKFSRGPEKSEPLFEALKDQCFEIPFAWRGENHNFIITTSVARREIQKPGIREAGNTDVGKFIGRKKSISFVRADREIAAGNFGFYKETEPRNRWWTIEIKFDASADNLMGVHNNKQSIEFTSRSDANFPLEQPYDEHTATLQEARHELWSRLSNHITQARKEAWKIVLQQHKKFDLEHSPEGDVAGIPTGNPGTEDATKSTDGDRQSLFTPEQREDLFESLKSRYGELGDKAINDAIDRFDQKKLKGCLLYAPAAGEWLWSYTNSGTFLVVHVNSNHPFYENVIKPMQRSRYDSGVVALELFLTSLADEEFRHFNGEGHRRTLDQFKSSVGMHLSRYITDNNIRIEAEDLVQDDGE